ncbi:hypothetical protein [Flavobacterium sp.]|jgi:hypothetical protein|uniref:hypothetical protein n=1 Tax=Flavobacterium sp. TaxID=239 RepID=UPI002A82F5AB|nr:hypothetical protein [Flavobacterium sp.]
MKNINKFLFAFLGLALLSSCTEDEDTTDQRIVKSVVAVDQTSFTLTEGETATVTMTINTPLNVSSDFKLELVSGTGSFRDITAEGDNNSDTDEETVVDDGYGIIGHKVTFPAYATTSTIDISAVLDLLTEGTETLTFRLYPMANSNSLIAADSEYITLTINDLVNDNLGIQLVWAQDYANAHGNIEPGMYLGADEDDHAYSDYDFDFWVEDEFGSAIDGYAAATGASPEFEILTGAAIPDGDYYIYVDEYGSGSAPAETFNHDLKINMTKYGVWSTTVQIPTTSDDTFSDYVVGFTKSGSTYTVFDAYDATNVYVTGRNGRKPAISGRNSKRGL